MARSPSILDRQTPTPRHRPRGPQQGPRPGPRPSPRHRQHLTDAVRRWLLTKLAAAGALVAGGAVSGLLRHSKREKMTEPPRAVREDRNGLVAPMAESWESGELTSNKVNTFMLAFARLNRKQIILIDQNGNPITGRPIPIPQELLDVEGKPNFYLLFQRWLNGKRRELKKQFPTIHYHSRADREEPSLLSVRGSLKGATNGENAFDLVWQNCQKPVSSRNTMNRFAFAERAIRDAELPEELGELFIGACAAESKFDEKEQNKKTGAGGAWQIMPRTGRAFGLSTSDLLDFEKSTRGAMRIIKDMYVELKRSQDVKKVMQTYGVSEEDFLFLATINSYQAGPPLIRKMCRWFLEHYPPAEVEEILGKGPYGKDLYVLMSSLYIQSGHDADYGKQSRDYVTAAMAMQELFELRKKGDRPEFEGGYEPPTPPRTKESLISKRQKMRGVKDVMMTADIGLLTGVVAFAADKIVRNDSTFSRRDMLFRGPLFAAAGVGAAFGGREAADYIEETYPPEKPVMKPADDPAPELPKPTGEEPNFGPYRLNDDAITESLFAHVRRFNIKPQTKEEIRTLKDRAALGVEVARRNGLRRLETADDIARAPYLMRLPEVQSPHYRLRGVGMSASAVANDPRYTYLHKHTEPVIREIDERLNAELQRAGWPSNLWVRLIVASVTRSEKYQKILREKNGWAARGDSPHTYGATFDLDRRYYDIIDGANFSMTSDAHLDLANRKLGLVPKLNAALGRVLIQMRTEGKLLVLHEGPNPVYHISDPRARA